MTFLDVIALALIQGITEFLPISSSGHLALWPLLTGRPDQGLAMDVAVHAGTLVAIVWYFREEMARVEAGVRDILRGRWQTRDARLSWLLALATVPAILAGLGLYLFDAEEPLRALRIIGWATIIGAVLLWLADRWGPERRAAGAWGLPDAVLMGLAQALALIPGMSRSGVTMTAARALGFERTEAARIALLMAVPVILAASVLEVADLIATAPSFDPLWPLLLGALLAALSAWAALALMFRMFRADWTMGPFVLYRLVLGGVLLWIAY